MRRVPWPGFVHQATISPSTLPTTELGSAGAHKQKSKLQRDSFVVKKRGHERRTVESVENGCLTEGVLGFSGGVTDIVALLSPPYKPDICVNLVGLIRLTRSDAIPRAYEGLTMPVG